MAQGTSAEIAGYLREEDTAATRDQDGTMEDIGINSPGTLSQGMSSPDTLSPGMNSLVTLSATSAASITTPKETVDMVRLSSVTAVADMATSRSFADNTRIQAKKTVPCQLCHGLRCPCRPKNMLTRNSYFLNYLVLDVKINTVLSSHI